MKIDRFLVGYYFRSIYIKGIYRALVSLHNSIQKTITYSAGLYPRALPGIARYVLDNSIRPNPHI